MTTLKEKAVTLREVLVFWAGVVLSVYLALHLIGWAYELLLDHLVTRGSNV